MGTDETAQLLEDARLMALYIKGITPDRNTQSEEEADHTEALVEEAVRRTLSIPRT